MWKAGLDEAQSWNKIAGRNINILRHADDITLMVESKKELKSLLRKVKEESENAGLKLNIQKTKIKESSPITSWQIDGKQWQILFSWAPKITADGDCSHEIKRCLLFGRKTMTNLDSILKSRDITLLTKVCIVKAIIFPVVMYGCESWTIKKAERWRIDAFELWCYRSPFRVPWTAKEIKPVNPNGNQSWIFIERTDAETKAPITFPPGVKCWLIRKDPDAGKDWTQEEKGMTEDEMVGWHHWLNGHEFEQALGDGEGQGSLVCGRPWGL